MNEIQVLDCTLRDGGYVNNWTFGEETIGYILAKLQQSNVDIIECGYLSSKAKASPDKTIFPDMETLAAHLPGNRGSCLYVAMIDYGKFPINELPPKSESPLDGIRVCFHKKDRNQAMEYCAAIKEKGYLVFLQPMVCTTYTEQELLETIAGANEIEPYALYFVDSFGVLKMHQVAHIFSLHDQHLKPGIRLGYHAHNNLQLAYSNAQSILNTATNRKLIIDCSVFGMGRGAGNLNTELFLEYLNENRKTEYRIYPLLEIIDQELNRIYAKKYWGYSLPYYLSAVNNCHPNYASYLADKNTLSVTSIGQILAELPEENKSFYSESIVEKQYLIYQNNKTDDTLAISQLADQIAGRSILLIAPGETTRTHKDEIQKYISQYSPAVIHINILSQDFKADYIFVGNQKRLDSLLSSNEEHPPILLTSNLQKEQKSIAGKFLVFNYTNLISEDEFIPDASGPMAIRLARRLGAKKVALAGLDGYGAHSSNYAISRYGYVNSDENLRKKNDGIKNQLDKISKDMELLFITPSNYQN